MNIEITYLVKRKVDVNIEDTNLVANLEIELLKGALKNSNYVAEVVFESVKKS